MTKAPHFAIEHAGYGCYIGFDHSPYSGEWKPMFKWSIPRTDPQVKRFHTLPDAQRELRRIHNHSNRYSTSYIIQLGGTQGGKRIPSEAGKLLHQTNQAKNLGGRQIRRQYGR